MNKNYAKLFIKILSIFILFLILSLNKTPYAWAKTTFQKPISNAKSRITKKPFGIKISPKNSPVKPERFSGYHTGVDFETLPKEQNIDIPIYAICNGTLIYKNWVSGYGGVAIEKCLLNKQYITVLYGHLKYSSISNKVGQKILQGNKIAILGKGYSKETDGERKHLHLGIHKSPKIYLQGYVGTKKELQSWLDLSQYLK